MNVIKTKADELAVAEGCTFRPERAERVREFFRAFLHHSKGRWAGKPFDLLPWQWEDIVLPLFAWTNPDGSRRFRVAYIEVPKKQGKSTLCSGLSLYMLIADGEEGSEVYNAAADRKQASIVFNEAANMVRGSPALSYHCELVSSVKRIYFPRTNSIYEALSADVPTKEGLNIHGLIFDEVHAQRSRKLWDTLRYGGASRRQPLIVAITTAGYDRESICWELHQQAKAVLNGSGTNPEFFAYIRAAESEDDWQSEVTWRKANPSYGITINPKSFTIEAKDAQSSPAKENVFRRYRLNQWTQQAVRWLSMEQWDKCVITERDLARRVCYAGLDLATTTDMAALALWFPEFRKAKLYYWCPVETAKERERRNKQRYDSWIARGFVKATEGNTIDYETIREDILKLCNQHKLKVLCVDRWNVSQLANELVAKGVRVEGYGQTYKAMTGPCRELERLVINGELDHDGNPVLRWNAENVAVNMDVQQNLKPNKKESQEKIDGVVALLMAIGRQQADEIIKESVYKTRGISQI